jgi:hypothetical protein
LVDAEGRDLIPDEITSDNSAITVTGATATTVTVQNDTAANVNANVLCERWHTVPRALPLGSTNLAPQPFIPATAGGGNVTAAAVIPDNQIVRGDGGARGVQGSLPEIDDAGDTHPPVDMTLRIGTAALRFSEVRARQLLAHNATTSPVAMPAARTAGVVVDFDPTYPTEQNLNVRSQGSVALGSISKYTTGVGRANMDVGGPGFGYGAAFVAADVVAYAGLTALAQAYNPGSLARGAVWAPTYNATLQAYARGAIASGFAQGSFGVATIYAGGSGSLAHGTTRNGTIQSTYQGGVALGYALNGYDILASNLGAFAFGYTTTADIIASAYNSAQIGPGTNALADSFQVGSTIRLKGTVGVPGAGLKNGDQWVDAGGDVLIRSGGASVVIGATVQKDYLGKTMSADQVGVSANDVVAFDTTDVQRGDLTSVGNQFSGLKAGRTYRFTCGTRSDSGDFLSLRWWDVTNGAWLACRGFGDTFESSVAFGLVTPVGDIVLEVRVWSESGATNIDSGDGISYALVEEI